MYIYDSIHAIYILRLRLLIFTICVHTTATTNTTTTNTANNTYSDDAPSNLKPKTNKKLKSPHIKAAEKAELDSQRSLSEIGQLYL